jgi:hypothetical protein
MARLLDDVTEDESLVAWLRVMFPEAKAESVLRPGGYVEQRPADSKHLETGGKNTLYGVLLHLLPGRHFRLSRIRSSRWNDLSSSD